jgi:hypothetical protein
MAYGLKIRNQQGSVTFDDQYRFNNNKMSGITVIPDGPAGTLSPFIPLSGADDPDKYLIFVASLYGPSSYEPVVGANGFRWRSTAASSGDITLDYLVMRIG